MAIDWSKAFAPEFGMQTTQIPSEAGVQETLAPRVRPWGETTPMQTEQRFVDPSIYAAVPFGRGTAIRPEFQQYASRYAFPGDAALGTAEGEGSRYWQAGIASPAWQQLANADPAGLSPMERFYRNNPAAFGQYIMRWSPQTGQSTERQVFRYSPEEFAAAAGWGGAPGLGARFGQEQSAEAQHARDQANERAAILEDIVPYLMLGGGLYGVLSGAGAAAGGAAGAAGGAGAGMGAAEAANLAWLEGVAPFGADVYGLGGASGLATGATGLGVDDALGAYLMEMGELPASSAYGQSVLQGTANWAVPGVSGAGGSAGYFGADPAWWGQAATEMAYADPIEALVGAMDATGAETASAAAEALGYASPEAYLAAINPEWASTALSSMRPASNLTGEFNTNMPLKAQIAEAGTLSHEGLTAAEMQQLGVNPLASQIGSVLPNSMTTSKVLGTLDTLSKANTVKNALGALGSIVAKPQAVSLEGRGTVGRGTQAYNDATTQELDVSPNEYFDDSYQTSVRFGQTGRKQSARAADGISSISATPRASGAVSAGAGARPGRSTSRLNVAGIPQVRPGAGY